MSDLPPIEPLNTLHARDEINLDAWAQKWFGGLAALKVGEHAREADEVAWFESRDVQLEVNEAGPGELTPDEMKWLECKYYVGRVLYRNSSRPRDRFDLNQTMGYLYLLGQDIQINVATEEDQSSEEYITQYTLEKEYNFARLLGRNIVAATLGMSEQEDNERVLERHAYYDSLTGLLNRRALKPIIEEMVKGIESGQYGGLGVLFVDFDKFKTINDALGHDAGDTILQEGATEMVKCVRSPSQNWGDVVVRMGGHAEQAENPQEGEQEGSHTPAEGTAIRYAGDEFIVLLPFSVIPRSHPSRKQEEGQRTYEEQAVLVGERIKDSLTKLFSRLTGGGIEGVGASYGVALWQPGMTADDVLSKIVKEADTRMLAQKERGRNGNGNKVVASNDEQS